MPDLLSISTWRNFVGKMGRKLSWFLLIAVAAPLVIGFGLSNYSNQNPRGEASHLNDVALKVNGEPITALQVAAASRRLAGNSGSEQGEQYAAMQGRAIEQLITTTALIQEAEHEGLRADEAEVDKSIAELRSRVIEKGAPDSEWDVYLQRQGMTASEFRAQRARDMKIEALAKSLQSKINVTEQDARNVYNQVKFAIVLIPTVTAGVPQPKDSKALPDADAEKKAEDLLAQVKAGADITTIAKANSGDPLTAKTGGIVDFRPEYGQNQQLPASFGVLFHGPEFDAAIHAAQTGQLTPVVKSGGFASGYAFAKILDRRTQLPKDFDAKKAIEQTRQQRAGEALEKLALDLTKRAKVDILDPDKKAFYDYYKLRMGQMSGDAPPSPQEQEQKSKVVAAEFEAMLKRRPDDATAAAIVMENVSSQLLSAKPEQRAALLDRKIQLGNIILQTTENPALRFDLASLYHERKQDDLALKQYNMIGRLQEDSPPADLRSMQDAKQTFTQLIAGYRTINQPALAAQVEGKMSKLNADIKTEQANEAREAAARKAAEKAAAPVPANLTVPAGGTGSTSKSLTVPAPNAPAQAPKGAGKDASVPPASGPAAAPPAKGGPAPSPKKQ